MDRSRLSKASSSKSNFLSTSNLELPRWRTPSPMAASIIPPPIVQSVYPSPATRLPTHSVILDLPSPLEERQSELEADLQFLLDAQAEGLVKGLEGGLQDDQASTGSTTPTAQSVRSTTARRGKTARRKPGLRSARKGIYNAILALSSVKEDELREIEEQVQDQEGKLEQIDAWEKKRTGLQEAARGADSNEDTVRVQRLRSEADVLQGEINAVELQLADMKARHRKLMRQASAVENSVQAKLASYTSSLRLLDEEVGRFLALEPTDDQTRLAASDGRASMWQLPPKRRTLEMARQQWSEERESVLEQRRGVEYEKAALDEGAVVWKDVVAQVTDFERRLRTEMVKLSSPSSAKVGDDPALRDRSTTLAELVESISQLTEDLDSKFQLSKDRNWNLLVAAVGAELDALRQAKQLLENILNPSTQQPEETLDAPQATISRSESGDEIRELDKNFETSERRMSNGTDSDDADPALLFSQHGTDGE